MGRFSDVLAISALIVVPTLLALLKRRRRDKEVWPFYSKKLLSSPEQVLYHRLVKALPEYEIFAQVQLSRMLGIKKGAPYRSWLNRIDRLSADFVICRKDSSVIAVVELDDASHDRPARRVTDAKKDRALGAAGIRVIRWRVRDLPDIATIRARALEYMGPN